jgi:hypothetical protein
MQSAVVFVALLGMAVAAPGGVVQQFPGSTQPLTVAASDSTIFRAPAHDSAVIKNDRQGGNFAYSVAESPAYQVVSPVVSHVTQPVATTYAVQQPVATVAVQQPVATTYTVQQPAQQQWTVAAAPAHTSTIVTGSTPVVSEVKTTVPVVATRNVATTYGATWPYASAYTYGNTVVDSSSPIVYSGKTNFVGNTVVDSSSPIVYSGKTNFVGIETEKQINQVHHTATAVQPAVTYTAVQQPSTATVVSSGTPVTFTSNVHQQLVSGTPAWSTVQVQQPANSIVSTGTQQWGQSAVVSSPIAATTYSVPSTSVISTGVPTFKTVSGVTPIGVNQWNNQWGYGYGQPWTGAWNQQVIV